MIPLLAKLRVIDKVIAYVKDDNFNLNTFVPTLFSIVKYAPLQVFDLAM